MCYVETQLFAVTTKRVTGDTINICSAPGCAGPRTLRIYSEGAAPGTRRWGAWLPLRLPCASGPGGRQAGLGGRRSSVSRVRYPYTSIHHLGLGVSSDLGLVFRLNLI